VIFISLLLIKIVLSWIIKELLNLKIPIVPSMPITRKDS